MKLNNVDLNSSAMMSGQASDVRSHSSDGDAPSSRELLQHIVNFFTDGFLSKQHAELYNSFAQALTDALHRSSSDENVCHIPHTLNVDFYGYTVTLKDMGQNFKITRATIEVNKDGESIDEKFDRDRLRNVSTVLLIRRQFDHPPSAITITDDEKITMAGVDLRGVNLRGADLCGADLSGTNLSGVDLSKTNLVLVNLNGANLNNANFHGADLNAAKLNGASLVEANLSWAELSWAELNGAIMRRANLEGTNLSSATLCVADLDNADLSKTRLYNADFSGANLLKVKFPKTISGDVIFDKAMLCEVDLRNRKLENVNLAYANLKKTNLHGANLYEANLLGANLTGANLGNAFLEKTNFQHADLANADVSNASFSHTDLQSSNLSGTNLSNSILNGVKLNKANLGDNPQADSLLSLPEWNPDNLDRYLNHCNNQSGSLLTTIDSIDEKHADLKVEMARKLVSSLQGVDVSAVALALMDVLSKAPYNEDNTLVAWLDTVCEQFIVQYNDRVMEPVNKNTFNQAIGLFTRQPERMFSENGAFIQLMSLGIRSQDEDVNAGMIRLYNTYLRHEKVNHYTVLDDFGSYGDYRPDWTDEGAANYILLSTRPDGLVMLLSQQSLQGMLIPDADKPVWNQFFLYNSVGESLQPGDHPPQKLFEQDFQLFLGPYNFASKRARFTKLIETLFHGDLQPVFISATNSTKSDKKLVSPADQAVLRQILNPKLTYSTATGDYSLTGEHYEAIIKAYGLNAADDVVKAKVLLSLAALFAKYSSSAIFGTEENSPEMLRRYAYALMEKAYALDAGIFKGDDGNDQDGNVKYVDHFVDWKNRLLGLNDAFSCTAVLTNIIVGHIRERFPDVLADIIPPAWN